MTRLYLYGGAVLAVLLVGFWAGWSINGWRLGAREKAAVEAAHAAEVGAQQKVIERLKTDIRTAQESSNAFQAELTRLRNQPVPIPAVRLCKPSRSTPTNLPAETRTSSGSDARSEAGRVVSEHPADDPGRDIGPELALLADEGDRCSAQLRALIDWTRRTR